MTRGIRLSRQREGLQALNEMYYNLLNDLKACCPKEIKAPSSTGKDKDSKCYKCYIQQALFLKHSIYVLYVLQCMYVLH